MSFSEKRELLQPLSNSIKCLISQKKMNVILKIKIFLLKILIRIPVISHKTKSPYDWVVKKLIYTHGIYTENIVSINRNQKES